MVPLLLVLLNVFSPHRFLGQRSDLLAHIGPVHARWLQFLRQYLEKVDQSQPRREPTRCPSHIEVDVRRATIGGVHVPPLERLSDFDKERLAGLLRCPMIHQLLDRALLESFKSPLPNPKSPRASASSSIHFSISPKHRWRREEAFLQAAGASDSSQETSICVNSGDWRWMFAFCVAALNDVRVDEVSYNDMEARVGASRQFTPLFYEMLASSEHRSRSPSDAALSSFSSLFSSHGTGSNSTIEATNSIH